jgi:hypothetical protein
MYIMAPESIWTAYFESSFHQSVCTYVHPPIVASQRLGESVTAATDNNSRIVGHVVFCVVRVVSRKGKLVCPIISLFPIADGRPKLVVRWWAPLLLNWKALDSRLGPESGFLA